MKLFQATVHGGWPICFGNDTREMLLAQVDEAAPDRVFILMDRTVEVCFGEEIESHLPHDVPSERIIFNEGEENKNLATLEHVAGDLLRAGATDRSLVLNVGGGVTLNLGGLAASLLGHGIRFGQVPTTAHAQWNVANTGRQAIHFAGGWNNLGVWRAPLFTIVDPWFTSEEPERQIRAAFVDFARRALVAGGDVFDRALEILSRPAPFAAPALEETLASCLELMIDAGREDPAEAAEPHADYGQPTARVLEILSDGRLHASEALWHAMKIAAHLSRARGVMNEAEHARHEALLARLEIQAPMPEHIRADRVIFKLHGNNKTALGGVGMMLLEAPGRIATERAGDGGTDTAAARQVTVGDDEIARILRGVLHEPAG